MGDWNTYKLGELVDLQNGFAFKGTDFIDDGVPVIKIKNVKPGRILLNDLSYVSREVADKAQRYRVLPNDILITMSGNRIDGTPDTWVGKVSMFNQKGEYLLNQRVGVLRVKDKKKISDVFLSQLLSSYEFQYYFISNATSSGGQANISPALIFNTEVKIPSLKEQIEIASIFSSLANKIELNLHMSKSLEATAQTICNEWFRNSELVPLSEYVEFNPRLSIKKDSTIKYVEMADLPESGSSIKSYIERSFTSGSKFQNYDTLLARITPCLENGKTALVDFLNDDEIAFGSTEFIVMRAKDGISPYYVYLQAREYNFREFAIKSMVGTSGRQRVQTDMLYSFEVPRIEFKKMKEFHTNVEPLFERVKINSMENQVLTQLRDSLLPKLMTGKILLN